MNDLEFFEQLYKDADTGYDAISILMPKVSDRHLRHDMALHMDGYRHFSRLAHEKLTDAHRTPKKEKAIARVPARVGMMMHTMFDTSTGHMAELMINGSNMGILAMHKNLNRLREAGGAEEAEDICKKVIDFEQDNIKRMNQYL